MSFSIFGKKKEDKKSSSADQKSTKDSLATIADTAFNTTTDSATSPAAASKNNLNESGHTADHLLGRNNASNTKKQTESAEVTQASTADIDYLLDANTDRLVHHVATVENISILEEAAILFAGKQVEATELILQSLIQTENTAEPNTGAWFMLFDLYQGTNNQTKFEHLRSEYANKWNEATPPNWRIPTHPTSTEIKLLLPVVIEGNTQQLINSISEFAGKHSSVQLDCSQLTRIDFTSCGPLLSGLIPISTMPGVSSIEFHDINHLVSAFLYAMGFKRIATISPRQH